MPLCFEHSQASGFCLLGEGPMQRFRIPIWADKACVYLLSDVCIGAFDKVSSHHIEGFGSFSFNIPNIYRW